VNWRAEIEDRHKITEHRTLEDPGCCHTEVKDTAPEVRLATE